MDNITINIPLPPKELHPNSRAHKMAVHRQGKKYEAWAFYAALNEMGKRKIKTLPWARAEITTRFYHKTKRGRDEDNAIAWMKAGFDGMADAGIVANDKDFRSGNATFYVDKDNPRVEVHIQRINDERANK